MISHTKKKKKKNSPQKTFGNFNKAFPVNAVATSVPYIQQFVQQNKF